jgi:KDO2-lipid IV(A) lauroyltransferase
VAESHRKKREKGLVIQVVEYVSIYGLLLLSRVIPIPAIHVISRFLGRLFFLLVKKRRTIAIENLRNALGSEKSDEEIRVIARESCASFFLTFLEIAKFRRLFRNPEAFEALRRSSEGLDALFRKAKQTHDESGGCIFVTPHIGNWEVLPHVSAMVGIPLAVVVRPLDNRYLERLIFGDRATSGQVIIPRKNSLFVLQKTLQQGRSIGMLPDQSTMRGILVDFFNRKATTTPVPALLAITYKRPIVVVACCRKREGYGFEGFVSDALWPGKFTSEKEELFRLTEAMNREMEKVVRKYPEQYLWMHNRWKRYEGKREFMT